MQNPLDNTGLLEEASELTHDMVALSRDALLTSIKFTNRPLAQLPFRIQMERGGCMTDGHEALFSPAFVMNAFSGRREVITRAYLHMIVHCLLRHPFAHVGMDDMLRWSVACDLACGAVLRQLECPVIAFDDPERDALLDQWIPRVDQPTAPAFYALLEHEGLDQDELARIEITIGMDSHELWIDQNIDGMEPQESTEQREVMQELRKRWEEVASATEMDMQQEDGDAPSSLTDQLRRVSPSAMSLEELLHIFAAPRETMAVSDDEFDYIYYNYGLTKMGGIALIEPLEYCEEPQLRDFCIAIDTSGSCSGPLVRSFIGKACGMLINSDSLGPKTRIWLIQCDCQIQDVRTLSSKDEVRDCLESLELKGFGGTDFRPVFDKMDQLQDSGTVPEWEALIYFTDGKGEYPASPPPYDVAFVFVDEPGDCPAWATKALTYSDELTDSPNESEQ